MSVALSLRNMAELTKGKFLQVHQDRKIVNATYHQCHKQKILNPSEFSTFFKKLIYNFE